MTQDWMERQKLREDIKDQIDYINLIISLSIGALALSVTFIKNILGSNFPKWPLAISWSGFCISILAGIFLHRTLMDVDEETKNNKAELQKLYGEVTRLWRVQMLGFVIGFLLLTGGAIWILSSVLLYVYIVLIVITFIYLTGGFKMKRITELLLKYIPIGMLVATIIGLIIMWGDFKLTHRPFLEIQPFDFIPDPGNRGEDESQVWCILEFKIINHGRTPAYDVKVDKLDVTLDRNIDIVKDVSSELAHLCAFPKTPVTKSITVTNSKVNTQEILAGKKPISYDIKIRYRGLKPIKEKDYYWYVFKGKYDKQKIIITDTQGN